jgi:arsenate reductase
MKKVLFIDRDNDCLGQIAEAFARRFGKELVEARSAGTAHAQTVDEMTKAVLKERGFDIQGCRTKGLETLKGEEFDICIDFGCWDDECSNLVSCNERRSWDTISYPINEQYAEYRKLREEIGMKVMTLFRELRGNT